MEEKRLHITARGKPLVGQADVRGANVAQLREVLTQCSQARPPKDGATRSCSSRSKRDVLPAPRYVQSPQIKRSTFYE